MKFRHGKYNMTSFYLFTRQFYDGELCSLSMFNSKIKVNWPKIGD